MWTKHVRRIQKKNNVQYSILSDFAKLTVLSRVTYLTKYCTRKKNFKQHTQQNFYCFEKLKIFLSQAYITLDVFGTILGNLDPQCSSTLYLFGLNNYSDMNITDESYVDETRVWRTKL